MYDILDFIQRRFPEDSHWRNGNCYWFAKILCDRFGYLSMYYEPIMGHFYAGICGDFYDHSGLVEPPYPPILFEQLEKDDPLWHEHILRDCMM